MKWTFFRKKEGFTLIELMVAVAIIGILVALATGSFLSYQAKSKQAEAKANLGSIGELALAYKTEYDTYVTNWTGIGWQPKGNTRYRSGIMGQPLLIPQFFQKQE